VFPCLTWCTANRVALIAPAEPQACRQRARAILTVGRLALLIPGLASGVHGSYWLISLIDEAERRQQARKNAAYLLLLATQIVGAIIFVWQELPEFEHLVSNPGDQLPTDIRSDLVIAGVFSMMQISFWCRLLYVPIPSRRPNLFLNHLFLFLGRLSFVFGGTLFAVVVFRHLPHLERGADVLQATERGMIFMGCLFALYCTSLEVERLGQAFERKRN
jgi:hypothetical protein